MSPVTRVRRIPIAGLASLASQTRKTNLVGRARLTEETKVAGHARPTRLVIPAILVRLIGQRNWVMLWLSCRSAMKTNLARSN